MMPGNRHYGALRKLVMLAHLTVLHGWVSHPPSAAAPWLHRGAVHGAMRASGRCARPADTTGARPGRAGLLSLASMAVGGGRSGLPPPPPPLKRRMDVEKADYLASEEEIEKDLWEDRKGRGKASTAFHPDDDDEDTRDLVPRDGLFYHDAKGNLRKMKFSFDMERGEGEKEAEEIYYDFMEQVVCVC